MPTHPIGQTPPIAHYPPQEAGRTTPTGQFNGRSVQQLPNHAGSMPHANPTEAKAPWVPHGVYRGADAVGVKAKLIKYAGFLFDHPEQMPADVKANHDKYPHDFIEMMKFLRQKHLGMAPNQQMPSARGRMEEIAAQKPAPQQQSAPPTAQQSRSPQVSQQPPTAQPTILAEPQGVHPRSQKVVSELRDYAIFVTKHPEHMPKVMQERFQINEGAAIPSFVEVLQHLMLKHIKSYEAPPPLQSEPSKPSKRPIPTPDFALKGQYDKSRQTEMRGQITQYANYLLNNPQLRPAGVKNDLYAEGMKPPGLPEMISYLTAKHFVDSSKVGQAFQVRFQRTGTPTHSSRATPGAVGPKEKFYHEMQRSSSGQCGMHATNAFLGGPVLGRDEYFNILAEETAREIYPDDPKYREDIKQVFLAENMNSEGSSIGQISLALKALSKREGFDSRLAGLNNTADQVILPQDGAARRAYANHVNGYKGDRIIFGRDGHFIALRKNTAHQWVVINSLRGDQEKVDLGALITRSSRPFGVIYEGDFDFTKGQVIDKNDTY